MMTAKSRRLGCAKLLLSMYADPTVKDDKTGMTPLHWCAINKDVELTTQILYWCADNEWMVYDKIEKDATEDVY
jgi:hypothetical protein